MIYVDDYFTQVGRLRLCHMMSDDQDILELHDFAQLLSERSLRPLPESAFHSHPTHPHYDICMGFRKLAISLGAQAVTTHQLVRILRRAKKGGPSIAPF